MPLDPRPTGVLILLGFLASAGLHADNDSQNTLPSRNIVYDTATVVERSLDSATASVTVIDRQILDSLDAVTVADVLRFVPGVDVWTGSGRGGFTTASIRGGDTNFTLVLVDGMPVNDGTSQLGETFDLSGFPAAAVEQIELVRGPYSSFYGSTGLAGVLHIRTRQGGEGQSHESQLTVGSADLLGVRHVVTGGDGARNYALGVSWEEESENVAEERFEQLHVHGNTSFAVGTHSQVRVNGRLTSWEADDYPTSSGGPVLGSGELRSSQHEEAGLGLEWVTALDSGRHEVTAQIYRHTLERDTPAIPPIVPPSVEDTTFTRLNVGWAWTRQLDTGVQWSVGLDAEHEEGRNLSTLFFPDFFGGPLAGDYDLERTTPGAHAELLVDRGPWTFEAAARFDAPEDSSDRWSPRLGVSYRLGDGGMRVRAAAGRAFKLPSFFVLGSPAAIGGNPDLKPETMDGGDVGIAWQGAKGEAGVDVFYHRYEDLIDFDFDLFTNINRARVRAVGVEGRLSWRFDNNLSLAMDVTWQDVEDQETGETLRQRPEWSGGLRLDWRARPALRFHVDARRVSERLDEQLAVPDRDRVGAYGVVGVGASWRFDPSWQLRLRLDNALDEDYEEAIGFPGPGATARLALRTTWGGR